MPEETPHYTAFHSNAPSLFEIAKRAFGRTWGERLPAQGDALVAVAFAAAALEAFMIEAVALARQRVDAVLEDLVPGSALPTGVPVIETFAALLGELEEQRSSPRVKFLLARAILDGLSYDRSGSLFRDFQALVRLRDAIMHMREDEARVRFGEPVSYSQSLDWLRSINILADVTSIDTPLDLVARMSTQAVARWACDTATAMVRSIIDVVPDSEFRRELEFFYGRSFVPVSADAT
jgi:hypothetical protein